MRRSRLRSRTWSSSPAAIELSVEHAWTQEAGATAFFTMIGGLIFLDTVGDVLNLSWMSPVGLTHALVLGFGTFAVSYGWLRARGR